MSVWSAQHYNAIAKEIRELFPTYDPSEALYGQSANQHKEGNMARRGVLSALALSLAHRFKDDNDSFDVMKFLTACSPDNDRFPITELWEDEDEKENG